MVAHRWWPSVPLLGTGRAQGMRPQGEASGRTGRHLRMIGQTISHYRVLDKLGEGGMGIVYRAQDTRLSRFVALKVLPAKAVADPDRRNRFIQEARAASALNHPNIVTVYDIGADFIAMEYVDGRPLDQVIGRRGLPSPRLYAMESRSPTRSLPPTPWASSIAI